MYAQQRRADVRFVRPLVGLLPSQSAPGQGAGAERYDASGPGQRRAPRPGPSIGGTGRKGVVQFDRGVERRQVGCLFVDAGSSSREFSSMIKCPGTF